MTTLISRRSLNEQLELPPILEVDAANLPEFWADYAQRHQVAFHVVQMHENRARTGKLWPATNIIDELLARYETLEGQPRKLGDSTSGGYGKAQAVAIEMGKSSIPDFPFERFVAVVTQSLPEGKLDDLRACNVEIDREARSAVEAMKRADHLAAEGRFHNTKQYWNPANSAGYHRVAKHIATTLPELSVMAIGVGSGGGCSGIMPVLTEAFRDRAQQLCRVAVIVEDGKSVGGVRDETALEPGSLKWRSPNIDDVRVVGEKRSILFSSALWRERGIVGGESTGFAGEGAMLEVQRLVSMGIDPQYRAKDGRLHVCILSMDTRDPYRLNFNKHGIYWQ